MQDGRPPDERGAANSISWTVKLKPYEVLASTLAAVAAAAAASFFGVKGTLVGAAIGSAVATSVAALVKQSADRAQEAMKKSGLASITSSLTRRSTATSSVGDVDASEKSQVPPEARAGVVGPGPRATDPSSETDHSVVAGIGDDTEPVFEEPTMRVPARTATEPTIVGSGSEHGAARATQQTPVVQTAMFERPGAAPHKRLRTRDRRDRFGSWGLRVGGPRRHSHRARSRALFVLDLRRPEIGLHGRRSVQRRHAFCHYHDGAESHVHDVVVDDDDHLHHFDDLDHDDGARVDDERAFAGALYDPADRPLIS